MISHFEELKFQKSAKKTNKCRDTQKIIKDHQNSGCTTVCCKTILFWQYGAWFQSIEVGFAVECISWLHLLYASGDPKREKTKLQYWVDIDDDYFFRARCTPFKHEMKCSVRFMPHQSIYYIIFLQLELPLLAFKESWDNGAHGATNLHLLMMKLLMLSR